MILSTLSKKMLMNATNSIGTGFPVLDVDEFVRLRQNNPILLSQGRLVLDCLRPISPQKCSCLRLSSQVAIVQHCQDVCRFLRPIRWLAASLCTFRSVGTAGGLSLICSQKLYLNNPSLCLYSRCASVFPWRAPWRVSFSDKEIRDG